MKIGRRFNELTVEEYCYFIEHYKKYDDFNTLGLYRSIIENDKLELADKIYVRDVANKTFEKTFNFLQLKDPKTYFDLTTLGQELTEGDERKAWDDIRKNQEKILADKRIKYRNFGVYSKHDCGFYNCPCPGVMIKKGSRLEEDIMIFDSDINKYGRKAKSKRVKKDRKREGEIIREELVNYL